MICIPDEKLPDLLTLATVEMTDSSYLLHQLPEQLRDTTRNTVNILNQVKTIKLSNGFSSYSSYPNFTPITADLSTTIRQTADSLILHYGPLTEIFDIYARKYIGNDNNDLFANKIIIYLNEDPKPSCFVTLGEVLEDYLIIKDFTIGDTNATFVILLQEGQYYDLNLDSCPLTSYYYKHISDLVLIIWKDNHDKHQQQQILDNIKVNTNIPRILEQKQFSREYTGLNNWCSVKLQQQKGQNDTMPDISNYSPGLQKIFTHHWNYITTGLINAEKNIIHNSFDITDKSEIQKTSATAMWKKNKSSVKFKFINEDEVEKILRQITIIYQNMCVFGDCHNMRSWNSTYKGRCKKCYKNYKYLDT